MKISSKLLKASLVLATVSMSLFSCKDKNTSDDDGTVVTPSDEEVVTENISAATTWTADKTYILAGRITVLNGATLTIEPGTLIKGRTGTGANATALLVARGGKLMAVGTADKPIIFTAEADKLTKENIANGVFKSPNLTSDINGLWGGVLICGKARISASNSSGDISEVQIEGIPTSDQNGLYGGTDDADNSGEIKYISIRHGGANIGAGNEINGLTLAGVGSGTKIENVEIVANQDDGIEWFGGAVSVKNAVVWNAGDDAMDTDQAWRGTLDNFIVITPGDHCFELDGPEGAGNHATHTIKNGTVVATSGSRTSADLINTDKNSMVNLDGIFFAKVEAGQQINRTKENPGVSFNNIVVNIPSGTIQDYVKDYEAGVHEVPAGITANGSSSNKADASAFAGWSWAAIEGATNGL